MKTAFLRYAGDDVSQTARICSSVKISLGGRLKIGADSFIGSESAFWGGNADITVGEFCDISSRVTFVTGSHEITPEATHIAGRGYSLPISIGAGCWVGACTTLLGGVSIGEKSIIAAGSVVTKSIPPYSIAAGVPCRVLKTWSILSKRWVSVSEDIIYDGESQRQN